MKNYGLPYVGSKSRIAKWLVAHLPDAPVLVDAFAGGCAITHAALESGKFDKVIANDINIEILKLFCDAMNGKYRNETRWIDRETFHSEKIPRCVHCVLLVFRKFFKFIHVLKRD